MDSKLQESVDKGPPSRKTRPGTWGALCGSEKLNRTLKKIGSLITDNYGNLPAQLLDRIGWRHLELGGDFEEHDDSVFRRYFELHMALSSDVISPFIDADVSVLDVIIENMLRQLVLHSTVRSPGGLNYELQAGFAFSIASILSTTNNDQEANVATTLFLKFLDQFSAPDLKPALEDFMSEIAVSGIENTRWLLHEAVGSDDSAIELGFLNGISWNNPLEMDESRYLSRPTTKEESQ